MASAKHLLVIAIVWATHSAALATVTPDLTLPSGCLVKLLNTCTGLDEAFDECVLLGAGWTLLEAYS